MALIVVGRYRHQRNGYAFITDTLIYLTPSATVSPHYCLAHRQKLISLGLSSTAKLGDVLASRHKRRPLIGRRDDLRLLCRMIGD